MYPVGEQGETSLLAKGLNTILTIEKRVAFPVGTSLIAQAHLKNKEQ
jgi:hypothetical protein